MEMRISEIKPLMGEGWARQHQGDSQASESRQIKPVPRNEGGTLRGLDSRNRENQNFDKRGNTPQGSGLEDVVQDVEEYLSQMKVDLSFKLHEDTGDMVVQVINGKTGEVVRQLPPDEVLELREKLKDLRGVLFEGTI